MMSKCHPSERRSEGWDILEHAGEREVGGNERGDGEKEIAAVAEFGFLAQ